jgi:acetyl esterase/lipase
MEAKSMLCCNFQKGITAFLLVLACLVPLQVSAKDAVTIKPNIAYSPSGQKLDICMPSAPRKATSLILIHGGGFVGGSRADLMGHCKLFAEGGFVVTTIDYRFSPQFPFPAAIEDAQAAIAWQAKRAASFGVDPKKIIVLGYSAGATIALSAGLQDNSGVAGIIAVSGISDFDLLIKATPLEKLRADVAAYLGKASAQAASPLSLVSSGDPPVFLFHGDADPLVPIAQSVVLAQKLKENNVPQLFDVLPGGGHDILVAMPHIKKVLTDITNVLLAYEQR